MTAAAALFLAAMPYLGRWSALADYLSALLPLALPLAAIAFVLGRQARPARLLALAAILSSLWRMAPEWIAMAKEPSPHGTPITIVTHNVRHGGSEPMAQVERLARSGAEILLLQENRRLPAPARERLALTYPYRDACGVCELAIMSKWPFVNGVEWRLPAPDGKGRIGPPLFRADIRLPDGRIIRVATLHAPRPLPSAEQQDFLARLVDAFRFQRPRALILAGDFNQTPWSHAMHRLDDALRPMRRITRGKFSYPAALPILPIDQMFISPDLTVEAVDTMENTGSDHRPIRVRLRLAENS